MRGVYRSVFQTSAMTAAGILIQITAPSTAALEILEASVGVTDNATNQQLDCYFQRASVAGSSPTVITPAKTENGDQAAGATVGGQPSGSGTLTANTIMARQGISSLGGYMHTPIPEDRIYVPPSGILVLRIGTTSFASSIFDIELVHREIG